MKDLFAKCGCNCGRCPSYKENLQSDEDRQRCSDGWWRYFGFRLSADKLRSCDGCQTPDDENPVRYQNCYVRKCAVKNDVETCAHCSGFPCEDVPKVSVSADAREKTAARLGAAIPEKDYLTFIEPYEGLKHLNQIRSSLAAEDIVEMTRVSVIPKIVNFSDDLPSSREETSAFEALHRLLAVLEAADGVSYSRQTALNKNRRHLLKILWAFGRFGELKEEDGLHLVIDGETYLAQKIHSGYSRMKDYFKILEKYGVRCEHVPLTEEAWLTPRGALRKKGWVMKLSFSDDTGGASTLRALQKYTARLSEEHGEKTFGSFSRADMRVLGRN